MITIFDTKEQFNTYTNNGQNIPSGFLYYVKEDETVHFNTNNIDGKQEIKNGLTDPEGEGYVKPSGNISLTENGTGIDVAQYATASVAVPQPSGNVTLTENGTNIDINDYATATVNVPIPQGYIQPTGNVSITQNGTGIDVGQYATATVAVPQPSGNITLTENGSNIDINDYATATVNVPIPQGYIQPTGNISITANANNIDVAQYATASVNVPSNDDYGHVVYATFDVTSNNTPINVTFNPSAFTKIELNGQEITLDGYKYDFGARGTYTLKYTLESTTTIPQKAFGWCYELRNISNIPSTITSIDTSAFFGCKFADFIIPYGVTSIGDNAFSSCSDLKTINIPNSVTSIGSSAFMTCNNLSTVVIGTGVTSIGTQAFYSCNGLRCMIINATTPPALGSNSISNNTNLKILVPAASVDTYKAASGWSTYASKIEAI